MISNELKIGGFQKNSLIDYPGKISCVIFLSGCNFICPYCHNPLLLKKNGFSIDVKDIYDFLKVRKGLIDAAVISGGEPTIQKGLILFCEKIKEIGYPIKLDTNGSHPTVIRDLINKGLVDYIAMDIKTDPLDSMRYSSLIREDCSSEHILESIRVIMESEIPYEFRTTCVKPFVDENTVETITHNVIYGAKLYILQEFHRAEILNPLFFKDEKDFYSFDKLKDFKAIADKSVQKCIIR